MSLNSFRKLRLHLTYFDSYHRKIATGFIWVSLFVIIGKIIGAAKEIAIAWRYGVSETLDAYVFLFNIITWPAGIYFSVLTVVLLPFMARLQSDSPATINQFRNELLGLTLIAALVLGILAYITLPFMLGTGWTGLPNKTLELAVTMAPTISLVLPLGLLVSLLSAWMMSAGNHRNTLLEAMPAFIILIAVLLPSAISSEPLVTGSVLGFFLQAIILAVMLGKLGKLSRPAISLKSPLWKDIKHYTFTVLAAQLLMSSASIIDLFFAAHLDTGAISIYSYANRVIALILSLGALTLTRSTLPVFSDLNSIKDQTILFALVKKISFSVLLISIVIIALSYPLIDFFVAVMFEHGAFTKANTHEVSNLLRILLLQIPFYFSGIVFMQYAASKFSYKLLLKAAFFATTAKILINIILLPEYSVSGLATSTVIQVFIWFAVLLFGLVNYRGSNESI